MSTCYTCNSKSSKNKPGRAALIALLGSQADFISSLSTSTHFFLLSFLINYPIIRLLSKHRRFPAILSRLQHVYNPIHSNPFLDLDAPLTFASLGADLYNTSLEPHISLRSMIGSRFSQTATATPTPKVPKSCHSTPNSTTRPTVKVAPSISNNSVNSIPPN